MLVLLLVLFENVDLCFLFRVKFGRLPDLFVITVEFEDGELCRKWSGCIGTISIFAHTSALIYVITEHHSFRRRSVSKSAAVKHLLKILLIGTRATILTLVGTFLILSFHVTVDLIPTRINLNRSCVILSLHLSIQPLVHVIFVAVVNLIQQTCVLNTKELILQQSDISFLIIELLDSLL